MLEHALDDELARLLPENPPFAVAYSGGGDSTALLHLLRERATLALVVDHRMTPGSAERTALAEARAMAMGVKTLVLKPATPPAKSSQAAARTLRYTLMGDACRAHGIQHLLTAHTQDDSAELSVMRHTRDSNDYKTIAPISHAAVWPGLHDIDIIRPLYRQTRQRLRDYLRQIDCRWIEDPANLDPRYERISVRNTSPQLAEGVMERDARMRAQRAATIAEHLSRLRFMPGWIEAPLDLPEEALELASRCAAGSITRGISDMKTSTGGGAHILRRGNTLLLTADPGTVFGRDGVAALPPTPLLPDKPCNWGNRFVIETDQSDLHVQPLGTRWLDGVPKPHIAVRRTLPGVFRGGDLIAVPGHGDIAIRYLAEERFRRTLTAAAITPA